MVSEWIVVPSSEMNTREEPPLASALSFRLKTSVSRKCSLVR